jgi:hypothetical protein
MEATMVAEAAIRETLQQNASTLPDQDSPFGRLGWLSMVIHCPVG